METFIFNRDELCRIWYRDCVEIKAESYKDAVKQMIEIEENEKFYDNVIYSEPLHETYESITPDEQSGCATIEIYDEESTIIWKNGK
jgi:hypothetical protein